MKEFDQIVFHSLNAGLTQWDLCPLSLGQAPSLFPARRLTSTSDCPVGGLFLFSSCGWNLIRPSFLNGCRSRMGLYPYKTCFLNSVLLPNHPPRTSWTNGGWKWGQSAFSLFEYWIMRFIRSLEPWKRVSHYTWADSRKRSNFFYKKLLVQADTTATWAFGLTDLSSSLWSHLTPRLSSST